MQTRRAARKIADAPTTTLSKFTTTKSVKDTPTRSGLLTPPSTAAVASKRKASEAINGSPPVKKQARNDPVKKSSKAGPTPEKATRAEILRLKNSLKVIYPISVNKYGQLPGYTVYPDYPLRDASEYEDVHRILTKAHDKSEDKTRYHRPTTVPPPSLTKCGCGNVPDILDAVLRTVLSSNMLFAGADSLLKGLINEFGLYESGSGKGSINWQKVHEADMERVVKSLMGPGKHFQKAKSVKTILQKVWAEHSVLSLEHMQRENKDEIMEKLLELPQVGVKTAACVMLFCLQLDCFAVDTHVYRFCKWLGWVPETANENQAYSHADYTVPNHLKYGLHQLLIEHGQHCVRCFAKPPNKNSEKWLNCVCPLEHLLDRSKGVTVKKEAVSKAAKKAEEDEAEEEQED